MYFTSGQDRAFERLMQEKPGFDHYDGGGANAPEDCGSCRFYRPDWKYQYCVYAECPYQPGKLTALAAVKFTLKGADDDMAVFRVEKNKGYTVMSNHHLRNKALSLKAKGLLSQMDRNNLRNMRRFVGSDPAGKVSLLMDHTARPGDVADPWYTGDFDATWRDVTEGCAALLEELKGKI